MGDDPNWRAVTRRSAACCSIALSVRPMAFGCGKRRCDGGGGRGGVGLRGGQRGATPLGRQRRRRRRRWPLQARKTFHLGTITGLVLRSAVAPLPPDPCADRVPPVVRASGETKNGFPARWMPPAAAPIRSQFHFHFPPPPLGLESESVVPIGAARSAAPPTAFRPEGNKLVREGARESLVASGTGCRAGYSNRSRSRL